MISQLPRKRKELHFERSYAAPLDAVWRAWTEADRLRAFWGPDKTTVAECEVELRVGGRIYIVTVASEEMGKRLSYDARSWTEREETAATIRHTNDVTLTGDGEKTVVTLNVSITEIGPKAKLAAFGMKWGYKSPLDALEKHLAS